MKAMFTVRRSSLRVPKVILGAMLIFGMWTALLGTPAKAGGVGSSALITIGPSSQSHAAGSAQTYDIALSCAGVGGASCGPNIQITIPLSSATTPAMVDPRWKYSATSGTTGLVSSGPTVSGNNLLLTVNPALFVAGYSGTIRLSVTPPNSVTPNNTSWSLTPSIDSDAISPVTAPNPAASTATAKPQTSISKSTSDGGSVYQVNGTVTYYLDAKCTTPSTGNLFVSTASIVDTLPAGVTYVSSTPAGAVVSGQTVTWEFSDASPSTMPAGCSAGASGVTRYEITATAPPTAAGNLRNTATFAGTGPDATQVVLPQRPLPKTQLPRSAVRRSGRELATPQSQRRRLPPWPKRALLPETNTSPPTQAIGSLSQVRRVTPWVPQPRPTKRRLRMDWSVLTSRRSTTRSPACRTRSVAHRSVLVRTPTQVRPAHHRHSIRSTSPPTRPVMTPL